MTFFPRLRGLASRRPSAAFSLAALVALAATACGSGSSEPEGSAQADIIKGGCRPFCPPPPPDYTVTGIDLPAWTWAGTAGVGTVHITPPSQLPRIARVSLVSTATSLLTVDAAIAIPPGASSAEFSFQAIGEAGMPWVGPAIQASTAGSEANGGEVTTVLPIANGSYVLLPANWALARNVAAALPAPYCDPAIDAAPVSVSSGELQYAIEFKNPTPTAGSLALWFDPLSGAFPPSYSLGVPTTVSYAAGATEVLFSGTPGPLAGTSSVILTAGSGAGNCLGGAPLQVTLTP
jgi:hypothetical protein